MSNNPEDLKLLTLAKATMARSNSTSAAALRDNTGRTYVAIPVKSGDFEVDSLIAVLVVVSFAFLYVFRKQNKELKNLRKVSGRGGDFQE